MKEINGIEIIGNKFAYDNCHKIYIIEDEQDEQEAKECGYNIYPIEDIKSAYDNSCSLKLISNWKLTKRYVKQFEDYVKWEVR